MPLVHTPPFRRAPRAVAAAALAACSAAFAQPGADQSVVITGNPLGRSDPLAAAAVLSGPGLVLRREGSIGQTLDGLPGVAASGFGPNSSRPVIRGLDADRIRLLDNGSASIDASNLSFDHAVATDPLVVDRIEVLRGPAALLYGGNATGGVVNLIDGRLPRAAAAGLSGRAELRGGGAARERAGAAVLEGGGGALAWHIDAYGRRSNDQRAPAFTPVEDGEALPAAARVRNSAASAEGGAVGAGWIGRDLRLGVALDTHRHDYGITVEPDVTIRLKRDRAALEGQWRSAGASDATLTVQASHTRYRHDEVEGNGEVGTTFASRGSEGRAEWRHGALRWLGGAEGVLGLQAEDMDFSALGEEAFVPGTRTRSQALFTLQEWQLGALRLAAGARAERVRVGSEGDAPPAAGEEAEVRFGAPAERRFTPRSAALSMSVPLTLGAPATAGGTAAGSDGWRLTGTLGHTERAPAYYELYANGLHLATAAFEIGDPTLRTESSRHAELGLAWRGRANAFEARVFRTSFSRYIALQATGARVEVEPHHGHEEEHEEEHDHGGEPDTVPEYRFESVPARLQGLEIEGRTRLLDGAWTLDLGAGLDAVRGVDRARGQALPRLPPLRWRASLDAGHGPWRLGLSWRRDAAQTRVPDTDTPTPGFTRVDLSASWQQRLPGAQALWFARVINATDALGFNAAATATVRGLAPLPGRALAAGVQLRW